MRIIGQTLDSFNLYLLLVVPKFDKVNLMVKKKNPRILLISLMIGLMVIMIIGLLMFKSYKIKNLPTTGPTPSPKLSVIAASAYSCADKKTIQAVYYQNQVELKLSDGRKLTVSQAESTEGARYASIDDSFVFWSKGNTAFIQEGQATTFSNCVEDLPPGARPKNTVSIVGELVCLPHKNQAGPQTLECAYGLKSNGEYYGLSDTDQSYKNISGVPMNKLVEVTGAIKLNSDNKYETIGTIYVTSINQIK
jgi:membrane-bound inhibitor of C-type lysozyme